MVSWFLLNVISLFEQNMYTFNNLFSFNLLSSGIYILSRPAERTVKILKRICILIRKEKKNI